MANTITVTNTFTANTKARSSEVNQNFTDLVNGLSDNTLDINPASIWLRDLAVTSDLTILSNDTFTSHAFLCSPNTTTGLTITLPTASASDGRLFKFKNVTGNGPVSIVTASTATSLDGITGTSGIILASTSDSLNIMCDGTDYHSFTDRIVSNTYSGSVVSRDNTPFFFSVLSTSVSGLTDGTDTRVAFDQTYTQTGSGFTTSGYFVAQSDGFYNFSTCVRVQSEGSTATRVLLYWKHVTTDWDFFDFNGVALTSGQYIQASGNISLRMNSGETLSVYGVAIGANFGFVGGNNCWFQGYKLK